MTSNDRHHAAHRPLFSTIDAVLLAGYAGVGVILGLWMGQDLNWDLLNYHFYNSYMLVDGRIARDVHAAGVQSYLNPLLDLPFYAAFRTGVPPRIFFLALAAAHGLGLYSVHRLTVLVVPSASTAVTVATGCLAALTAAFGAGFLSEVGNTMHDNTLALLVLAALWWMLAHVPDRGGLPVRVLIAAGVVTGAAAGLKLAMGPLSIGLCAAACAIPSRLGDRVRDGIVVSAAVGVGVMLTGGFWMWVMYRHFGSPLFPFVNAVFASPFAPLENFADLRFMPRDSTQAVFYPFYWTSLQNTVTELLFRDGRMAAGMVGVAVLAVAAAFGRLASEPPHESPASGRRLTIMVVFWIVSYVVWLRVFAVYRYLIPLEMLGGVIVIGAAARLAPRWTAHLALSVPVCLLLIFSIRVPDWGRTAWTTSYFGVETRLLTKYAGATILMWDFPQGYLPPHFPSSSTFIRILTNWGLSNDNALWQRAVSTIGQAGDGSLYLLDREPGYIHEQQPAALARLGLARVADRCETHPSLSGGFRLCALRRTSP
jgi:hypothetical protein